MRKSCSEFPRTICRYVILCIVLSSALFVSAVSPTQADDGGDDERPFLFVWAGDEKMYQNVKIHGAALDQEGFFNETELTKLPDSGYFLFLTHGSDKVPDAQLREKYGIKDEKLAEVVDEGHAVRIVRNSTNFSLSTNPVKRTTQYVILLDWKQMEARYRRDCIREIIFLTVVGRQTKDLISSCKLEKP